MESAGNLIKEKIKEISDHIKNHKSLLKNDEQFGYYLAGLIEGNGEIKKNSIEIKYNKKDIQAAYWLKKRIGAGKVKSDFLNPNNYIFILDNLKAFHLILQLINGKFITNEKIKEWKETTPDLYLVKPFLLNNTYYLTGYFEGKGNLSIKKEETTIGYKLECIIENTSLEILEKLKNEFGGEIDLLNNLYKSSSFSLAKSFIDYFDKYTIVSMKYIEYLKWRDCYRIIQRKEYMTEKGLEKIDKLKKSLLDLKSSYSN